MLKLRPYQSRAVHALTEHASPLLVAPTGSGKTAVAAQLALDANGPVVILTHAIQIVRQTAERFRAYGLPCGVLAAGVRPRNEIAIAASIQTVARMQALPEAFLVIVDEAHRAAGASYQSVIARYRQMGARVVGLTATPCRLDGTGLSAVGFDSIVEPTSYEELYEAGVLVRPDVWAPNVPNLKGVHVVGGDLSGSEAADRIVGDFGKEFREKCPDGIAIAFACSINHARALAGRFYDAGLDPLALDGAVPIDQRDEAVKRLEQRELRVIVTCGLFGEGFDLPSLDAVILARPTLSLALYRQQCGRVMRSFAGKAKATILDHAGNSLRHGLPDEPVVWTLNGRQTAKRSAIKAKRCAKCFAVYGSGLAACPQCGFAPVAEEREIQHVAGELVKVASVLPSVAVAVQKAHAVAPGDSRAVAYVLMARKAQEKGYKAGWLPNAFKAKFGVWPPKEWEAIA